MGWQENTYVKAVLPSSQTTIQIRGRTLRAIIFDGICMMAKAIV